MDFPGVEGHGELYTIGRVERGRPWRLSTGESMPKQAKQVRQKGKVRESDCGIVLRKRVMTVEGRLQHNNALSKETSVTLEVRNKWQRDLKR